MKPQAFRLGLRLVSGLRPLRSKLRCHSEAHLLGEESPTIAFGLNCCVGALQAIRARRAAMLFRRTTHLQEVLRACGAQDDSLKLCTDLKAKLGADLKS